MKNNKLIAEFMGYEYFGWNNPNRQPQHFKHGYWVRKGVKIHSPKINMMYNPLLYNTSWDWLMPVVIKIHQTKMCEFVIRSAAVNLSYNGVTTCFSSGMKDLLELTYTAVVQFINWYNQQES